ncbi:MAG: ATP-binding protein [Hylemonella sp.]|nr:ATP-binding protein [Hylemonella sp.]MDH5707965.1 ATP-binding protein [Hylemonella sp.]
MRPSSRPRAWDCCRVIFERGARRTLQLLAGLLLAPAACLAAGEAVVLELRQAQVHVTRDGQTQSQPADLPYHWDRMQANRSGEAVFEFHFKLALVPSVPYAVLFSRVGNTARIWLNGTLLSSLGDMNRRNVEDYVKAPQYVRIPPRLLQLDNVLQVRINADGGRRAGLSRVLIGAEDEMRERYEWSYRWRVTGQIVVAVFSLVVGVIALMLWLTQQERVPGRPAVREGVYLSAGIAMLCWMLRMVDGALTRPPLPWPWWGLLQNMAYAGFVFSAALFCHRVAGWHLLKSMRWVRLVVAALLLAAPVLFYLGLTRHEDSLITGWYGVVTFLFVGYSVFYIAASLRHPNTERLLVTVVGVFNVGVGVRDWIVIRAANNNFEQVSWMRFSSALFGLALGYIVITRFRAASEQVRDLMQNMAEKIRNKEQELALSYRELEQLAREQARTAERGRILRDMHDGVGSHLSAAIRQLQSGKSNREELLQTLRDSLDQLKLSIDAMNLAPGDVTAMLAGLRYRLESRFKALDLELIWDVDLVAPLAGLDTRAMQQLQFMVFEAISNVLQHAQAKRLMLEFKAAAEGGATLRIIDDGRGFEPGSVERNGLKSLRERAAAIGAGLNIERRAGQTVVEIGLGGAGPRG